MNKAKKPIIDPQKIQLVGIRVIKAVLNNSISIKDAEESNHESQLEFFLDSGLNMDANLYKNNLTVKIQPMDKKGNKLELFCEMTIEFVYFVENLKSFVHINKKKNTRIIDSVFGATVASISFSTARGIIYTRTLGTSMKGFILPVINPNDLIADQMIPRSQL